jgi:predicted flap endonuclease-1-like 5' DNA nuclease
MSSFFWLLLYLAPLLGLTAVIFAWLGWKWRGTDLSKIIQELQTRINDINAARSAGEVAHDTLRSQILAAEDGLRTSRDELQAAQEANRLSQHEFIQVQESSRALQSEHAQTLQELETLRTERDHVSAALAAAHAEIEHLRTRPEPELPSAVAKTESAPAEKPKRKRPSTASPPKTANAAPRSAGLQGTLAALEVRLAAQAPTLAALTQERDDWQRRVTKMESHTTADPAGLGLAYRSLADSEKRLQSTAQEIERLKNQARVLQRVTENAAALAGTPDDDLTRIKGIKNVISEQLRAHGIRTWRQIAQWNDEELSAFSEILAFKNRATREQWKEQARALHEAAHGPLS